MSSTKNQTDRKWSQAELTAAVKTYLKMQRHDEQSDRPLNKTLEYRKLSQAFGRSVKAFEYRMLNISYVMLLHKRPWIDGLKPAKNVGSQVIAEIESILAKLENRPAVDLPFIQALQQGDQLPKPKGKSKPKATSATVKQLDRDPDVKAWVLIQAKGICEGCGKNAPFISQQGMPYLEVHHVIPLAEGGPDTPDNAVAICPNCHKEAHFGEHRQTLAQRFSAKIASRS